MKERFSKEYRPSGGRSTAWRVLVDSLTNSTAPAKPAPVPSLTNSRSSPLLLWPNNPTAHRNPRMCLRGKAVPIGCNHYIVDVAHALLRAASRLLSTLACELYEFRGKRRDDSRRHRLK